MISQRRVCLFSIFALLSVLLVSVSARAQSPSRLTGISLGSPQQGVHVRCFWSNGKRGIAVEGAGLASVRQPQPITIEIYSKDGLVERRSAGYDSVETRAGRTTAIGSVSGPGSVRFQVRDEWTIRKGTISVVRTLRVAGSSDAAFLSALTLPHEKVQSRAAVDYFAPGMIYGSFAHLSAGSIGGRETYEGGGAGRVRIREDRLPAPVFGVHFSDGSSFSLLDEKPDGATTAAESHDTEALTMTDPRFRFGAIGVEFAAGRHEQGFWYPGTEGEVTYSGNTYPGGQQAKWRRRYHPITDGFTQQYTLAMRVGRGESFSEYTRGTWRWAYAELAPRVNVQDLAVIQRSIVDVLASQVIVNGGRAGIPNFLSSVSAPPPSAEETSQAIMGFTGKNLEAAEFLLADSASDTDASRAARDRELGLAIFASFIHLKMDPPSGEGFDLRNGQPALAIPRDQRVYLRSFADDMKATLRAYRRERQADHLHPEWLAWTRSFGDWLLTQQYAGGGFPRSWRPVTGEIVDRSQQSSYNPVPFLVLLAAETGEPRYLNAASRAAEYAWDHGQADGQFVGGTIDNPDVLDKEAGTLSLEAYVALYDATHQARWLSRARTAADYAETYIYVWNVPMPAAEDSAALHWKPGIPTIGTQLIATGHSLVDEYMAFDVDNYARLARDTKDPHYLDVARVLLHGTKSMVATPERPFDLRGPGWQQEHWSFAPRRGYGLHRGWLPWVATSQLKGIIGLREFDPQLYRELAAPVVSGTKQVAKAQ